MYKIIVFDLDDTLTPSKWKVDDEMLELLSNLTNKYKVAIITWWEFIQITKQVISHLDNEKTNFNNFYIFPTCWAKMYEYINWEYIKKYSENLTKWEIEKITTILENAIEKLWLKQKQTWWQTIENRWTQITYSPLWNETPLEIKSKWDIDCSKRHKIREYILGDLSEFQIWIAWKSSIDITKKGIDKSYWIKKIISEIWIKKEEILFIWDMLIPGGNDYPVKQYWINCKSVNNPEDTKLIIKGLIK